MCKSRLDCVAMNERGAFGNTAGMDLCSKQVWPRVLYLQFQALGKRKYLWKGSIGTGYGIRERKQVCESKHHVLNGDLMQQDPSFRTWCSMNLWGRLRNMCLAHFVFVFDSREPEEGCVDDQLGHSRGQLVPLVLHCVSTLVRSRCKSAGR